MHRDEAFLHPIGVAAVEAASQRSRTFRPLLSREGVGRAKGRWWSSPRFPDSVAIGGKHINIGHKPKTVVTIQLPNQCYVRFGSKADISRVAADGPLMGRSSSQNSRRGPFICLRRWSGAPCPMSSMAAPPGALPSVPKSQNSFGFLVALPRLVMLVPAGLNIRPASSHLNFSGPGTAFDPLLLLGPARSRRFNDARNVAPRKSEKAEV